MEIEEFIFGDNLRKRSVCFFYRCSWYLWQKLDRGSNVFMK